MAKKTKIIIKNLKRKVPGVQRGCGIDIDKLLLWVTICTVGLRGSNIVTQQFDNNMTGIAELIKWLKKKKITHVMFESTGYYWQMLYSQLEGHFIIYVANAQQTKPFKGKKTDLLDSKTLAELLRHGAIRPSHILPKEFREFRDLTRRRHNMTQDMTRVKNRIHQTLWHASLPLDTCMSDLFGKSGELMIEALIKGTPGKTIAQLAQRRMKQRIPELEEVLRFPMSKHFRIELQAHWRQYKMLKKELTKLSKQIARRMRRYQSSLNRLDTAPGFAQVMAQNILSEIGINLKDSFPDSKHFCNWIKICPGNNSSANKRKSGKNGKGNKYLKSYLVEAAWAAVHTKGCGLRDLYYRRCARMGKKKAIVSVAHKLARIIYTMLTKEMDYNEAYEDNLPTKHKVRQTHMKLKQFNNESLITELLRRGVKEITWHHEDPPDCCGG